MAFGSQSVVVVAVARIIGDRGEKPFDRFVDEFTTELLPRTLKEVSNGTRVC